MRYYLKSIYASSFSKVNDFFWKLRCYILIDNMKCLNKTPEHLLATKIFGITIACQNIKANISYIVRQSIRTSIHYRTIKHWGEYCSINGVNTGSTGPMGQTVRAVVMK